MSEPIFDLHEVKYRVFRFHLILLQDVVLICKSFPTWRCFYRVVYIILLSVKITSFPSFICESQDDQLVKSLNSMNVPFPANFLFI